jgi:Domain of unknown function (DUF4157)
MISDPNNPNDPNLDPDAQRDQGEHGESTDTLSDELTRKYDPSKLLRMVSKRAGKGEPLDHAVRAKYEKKFGVDLGHVRIYTGEFAEEFNRKRDAYAVTIGSTGMILMGGSPDKAMDSRSGQALLAHELTHVAQRRGGLHRKALEATDFTPAHEAEAEGVEAAELGGGVADTIAEAAKALSAEDLVAIREKIERRVMEIAADAARSQAARNGTPRRA